MKLKRMRTALLLNILLLTSCQSNSKYIPYNLTRSFLTYTEEVGERLSRANWDSALSFMKSFPSDSVFSPLSLFDLTAIAANLTTDNIDHILEVLHYPSFSQLKDDMDSYRNYFNFTKGGVPRRTSAPPNAYRARLSRMMSLPKGYNYSSGSQGFTDRFQLAFLKNGDSKLLEEELAYIKEASFGFLDDRWSTDSYMSLTSAIAYEASFPFTTEKKTVRFKDKDVEGFLFNINTNYLKSEKYEVIEIPLQEEKLVIYLPQIGITPVEISDLNSMVTSLTNLKTKPLEISMPNFTLNANVKLTDIPSSTPIKQADELMKIGSFDLVFDKQTASILSKPSNITQQTSFAVDKRGVKAASATTIKYPTSTEPGLKIAIDRPFNFALLDRYDVPLFIGNVTTI